MIKNNHDKIIFRGEREGNKTKPVLNLILTNEEFTKCQKDKPTRDRRSKDWKG